MFDENQYKIAVLSLAENAPTVTVCAEDDDAVRLAASDNELAGTQTCRQSRLCWLTVVKVSD